MLACEDQLDQIGIEKSPIRQPTKIVYNSLIDLVLCFLFHASLNEKAHMARVSLSQAMRWNI